MCGDVYCNTTGCGCTRSTKSQCHGDCIFPTHQCIGMVCTGYMTLAKQRRWLTNLPLMHSALEQRRVAPCNSAAALVWHAPIPPVYVCLCGARVVSPPHIVIPISHSVRPARLAVGFCRIPAATMINNVQPMVFVYAGNMFVAIGVLVSHTLFLPCLCTGAKTTAPATPAHHHHAIFHHAPAHSIRTAGYKPHIHDHRCATVWPRMLLDNNKLRNTTFANNCDYPTRTGYRGVWHVPCRQMPSQTMWQWMTPRGGLLMVICPSGRAAWHCEASTPARRRHGHKRLGKRVPLPHCLRGGL